MRWKPRVTVASVIEKQGKFLIIEEQVRGRIWLNQPAGHLEPGESLVDAVRRETLEESGYRFDAQGLVGLYLWDTGGDDGTFLRVTFFGTVGERNPATELDDCILDVHWMDIATIEANEARLRSPLVVKSLTDYLAGKRYPLDLLTTIP